MVNSKFKWTTLKQNLTRLRQVLDYRHETATPNRLVIKYKKPFRRGFFVNPKGLLSSTNEFNEPPINSSFCFKRFLHNECLRSNVGENPAG